MAKARGWGALAMLALPAIFGADTAAGFPFPCVPVTPCEEAFLLFQTTSSLFDPCFGFSPDVPCMPGNALQEFCQPGCQTCPRCEEPDPLPGFDVVLQPVPASDTTVVFYALGTSNIAGFQFQSTCTSGGVPTPIGVLGSITNVGSFTLSTGIEGKALLLSLSGEEYPVGYNFIVSYEIESLQANNCDPGSYGLTNVIVAGPMGEALSFCGTLDQPCPELLPSPPLVESPSPPPSAPTPPSPPPSAPTPPSPPAAFPFPCEPTLPCADDPTFLLFGAFSCESSPVNPCTAGAQVLEACQLTCATCQPCEEPDPIPGVDVVLQIVPVSDTTVVLYALANANIAGFQFESICTRDGVPVPIAVSASITEFGSLNLFPGAGGLFLVVSVIAEAYPAGYIFLVSYEIESLEANDCDPGSYGLRSGTIASSEINPLSFCGTLDQPCPGLSPSLPSPPLEEPPSPPLSPPQIKSDPHFVGLRGQHFDVTGVAGRIYSIIADGALYINARYATAYTTGLYIEPESLQVSKMRSRGTWMSDIGCVLASGVTVQVSVALADKSFAGCSIKPKDCLRDGSVTLNEEQQLQFVGDYAPVQGIHLQVRNTKSYSSVRITAPELDIAIDIVPAPEEWGVSGPEFAHLNLKLNSINLSSRVTGVLGDSARLKYDDDGAPIISGLDEDGAGILDGSIETYEVPSLVSTSHPLLGR